MASAQEQRSARLPVVVAAPRPATAAARAVQATVEGHLSLQGARLRGLKGGAAVIAEGHAGYLRTQDLGRGGRKGLDLTV